MGLTTIKKTTPSLNAQAAGLLTQGPITATLGRSVAVPAQASNIQQSRIGSGYGGLAGNSVGTLPASRSSGVGNISLKAASKNPVADPAPSNVNADGTHPYPKLLGEINASLGLDPIKAAQLTSLSEQKARITAANLPEAQKQMYLSLIDSKIGALQSSLDPSSSPAGNPWIEMVQKIAADKQAAINSIAEKYGPDMAAMIDSSGVNERYKTQYKTLLPMMQARLQAQGAGTAQDDILKYLMSLSGYLPGTQPIVQSPNATSALFTT